MLRREWFKASVSLFLALILPSSVFVLLAGLRYAEERKKETDAARAMSAAQELLLAHYSRELWRDYGLWAYMEEEFDMDPALRVYGREGGEFSYEEKRSLFEEGRLREQILRFMRLRAPAFAGAEMLERIRSAALERSMLSGQSSLDALRAAHRQSGAYEAYRQGGQAVSDYLGSEQTERDDEEEFWTEVGEGLREEVEGSLRSFSRYMLPVYEAAGTENLSEEELFSPSLIESLAVKTDQLLDLGLGAEMDRLCLAQYVLSYFPSEVHLERVGGGIRLLRTPNGDPMQELRKERPSEAEQIASGRASPGGAKRYCSNMITLFRFIPRYLASFRDAELQEKYRFYSEILAIVIAAVSLGQADIPPQVLRYFIQLAHSLYLAKKDTDILLDGYSLSFWPAKSKAFMKQGAQYELYYRDYLFLLLLLRSPEELTRELTRVIQKNQPGEWYTAFQLQFRDGDIQIEREAEYLNE